MKPFTIKLLVIVLIVISIAIFFLSKEEKHSPKFNMMSETTMDIDNAELLRVESGLEEIMNEITKQDHLSFQKSDSVVSNIILELQALKEEAEFHNQDKTIYNETFIKILDQLAYVELEGVEAFTEIKEHQKAIDALLRARQHLLDAESLSSR